MNNSARAVVGRGRGRHCYFAYLAVATALFPTLNRYNFSERLDDTDYIMELWSGAKAVATVFTYLAACDGRGSSLTQQHPIRYLYVCTTSLSRRVLPIHTESCLILALTRTVATHTAYQGPTLARTCIPANTHNPTPRLWGSTPCSPFPR